MPGVEILATQEVATAFTFSWENFWFGFTMLTIVGLCLGIFASLQYDTFLGILTGLVLGIIFGILVGVGVGVDGIPTEYETQYKVTISDEVPMNDFLARYEIVDQEGKIYTVRENNDKK